MDFQHYKRLFSKNSIGRYDITPVFSDIPAFEMLTRDLASPFSGNDIDRIIGIDAIGFVLGSAVALHLRKGLVLARKSGKLPLPERDLLRRSFTDYTAQEKTLELNKNLVERNSRILIVDDWVETGSQVRAVISMIEEAGASVAGISCIGFDRKEDTEELYSRYHLHAIGINV